MRSPVCFMTLEQELMPVLGFLQGDMLNAGCGGRDIGPYLKNTELRLLINCDIAPQIPGAFSCTLDAIPKPDKTYDAVLCNAVLEHVVNPAECVKELFRVLKRGGFAVLTIPFLQPYHPCPGDFQRYTVEGIRNLVENAGGEVVQVTPVHSLAQTLGWIFWAYLEERQATLRQWLCWLPIKLFTRFCQETSGGIAAANCFQLIACKV